MKPPHLFTDKQLIFSHHKDETKSTSDNWEQYDVGIYHTKDGFIHHETDCAFDWKDCPMMSQDDQLAYKKGLLRLFWIQKGIVHRENGPAIIGIDEYSNRVREWHYVKNGLHQNSYGPAAFSPNIDFKKHIYAWSYKSRFIIPVEQKLQVATALDLPGVGMVTVLKHLDGYIYEVLYGNKKFPIIGSQNVRNFDIDYYMAVDFDNLFESEDNE